MVTENKLANSVKMTEKNSQILFPRLTITLAVMKMIEINSEMTVKLRPTDDILPKFLKRKLSKPS